MMTKTAMGITAENLMASDDESLLGDRLFVKMPG
jgi:hypothetical protein